MRTFLSPSSPARRSPRPPARRPAISGSPASTEIRVDGPYKVTLTTGVAPFATRDAARRPRSTGVAIEVRADTLVVRNSQFVVGRLSRRGQRARSRSASARTISAPPGSTGRAALAIDKVKGLSFDLSVQGSGSASDRLGRRRSAQASASRHRAAPASPARRRKLTAIVRGISTLDAAASPPRTRPSAPKARRRSRPTSPTRPRSTRRARRRSRSPAARPARSSASGSASVSGCR